MFNQSELTRMVNKALVNIPFNSESERLIEPVRYILSMGGKRLRPVLALMACNLFTDKIDDALMPVTGLEIFHNFTLVHDDIMDNASLRRGLATVHHKWDLNQAILSGDVMAFIANECFLHSPSGHLQKVFRIFSKAAIEVCIGQQMDMDYEESHLVYQDEYIRMIALKTAALIAASVQIGAVLGGASDKDSELISEFGRNLGLAFQIQDDLLDTYGDVKVFGKKSGGDILSGKKTFLYVKALELAGTREKKMLQEEYGAAGKDPETMIKNITGIFDLLNIKFLAETLAREYYGSALGYLDRVSVLHDRKKEILQLTESLMIREQ
jgi:geranylgeranyl diphosphate synthase type II